MAISKAEAWLSAFCSVASAANCREVDIAERWADNCIEYMNDRGMIKDEIEIKPKAFRLPRRQHRSR